MRRVDRRAFLKIAGTSSVAVAAAGMPSVVSTLATPSASTQLSFRATAGLPAKPASMATRIVEGTVDLSTGTGVVTSRVLAGHPVPSQIALPGLTQLIRITAAHEDGGLLRLTGVVDDRSQLRRGESPDIQMTIDRAAGTLTAPLAGNLGILSLG